MRILLYRGISPMSRLIRLQTRSIYSHAAIEFEDMRVAEAWAPGGVRIVDSYRDRHTPKTIVDGFEIDAAVDEAVAREWLLLQVGKGYDYLSVARFLTRRKAPDNDKWFCSELVLRAVEQGGCRLLHGAYSTMTPRDVAISPLLRRSTTWIC